MCVGDRRQAGLGLPSPLLQHSQKLPLLRHEAAGCWLHGDWAVLPVSVSFLGFYGWGQVLAGETKSQRNANLPNTVTVPSQATVHFISAANASIMGERCAACTAHSCGNYCCC